MGTIALLLAASHLLSPVQAGPGDVWEESVMDLQRPGYHPAVRFYSESKFLFISPKGPVQGRSVRDAAQITFRPETASELNHADIDKLFDEDDAGTKARKTKYYEESLISFAGVYEGDGQTLTISYPIDGTMKRFTLHSFTYGDAEIGSVVNQADSSMVGVWYAPEPFPDKLDSKTRFRIGGLDGLKTFAGEAFNSDLNQFKLLDLRRDNTFRIGGGAGRWNREGDKLHLKPPVGGEVVLSISADLQSLSQAGHKAFIR